MQKNPYHNHPSSSQPQYPTNGLSHDITTHHSDYSNGHHPNGAADMNPYQQHPYGYGQPPPPPPPQQQQQQQAYPQQPQHPQQRMAYPQPQANQLPPLGPPMGQPMPGMQSSITESPSSHRPSSANPAQPPGSYMSAPPPPPPPMQPPQQASMPPQQAPPSRAGQTTATGERKMSSSSERDGLRYSLEVVQQPQRARMCGFGDKDRRPITPPPCVRLVIVDVSTGREIDIADSNSDASFFVLQVDLWAETADREANVVRASSNSPAVSISSATTTSYPPPAEPQRHYETQQVMYMSPEGPVYAHVPYQAVGMSRPGMYPMNPQMFYGQMGQQIGYPPQAPSSNAMFTRNLIGSLTVNASRLKDNDGKEGFWFVLQDLSVRTEGFFRLRMSFIDISVRGGPHATVNRGTAPVLAWTFSDKFQVYSAKKFPGVIESTPLSKVFAGQGIKIPIRKDNKNDDDGGDDGD